jgi:hypothetical protein
MELVPIAGRNGTVTLVCRCGRNTYTIEIRKSESCLMYEELRGDRNGKPDTLVAICQCGDEVVISSMKAQMPPPTNPYDVIYDFPRGYKPAPGTHGVRVNNIWTGADGIHIDFAEEE